MSAFPPEPITDGPVVETAQGKVRGFTDNTLGPSYTSGYGYQQPLGGSFLLAGSVEAIFPKLFDSPAARISAFLDFGNVYDGWDNFSAGELRASTGIVACSQSSPAAVKTMPR